MQVREPASLKRKYGSCYETVDAKGKGGMPGFINTDQHAAMSPMRRYAGRIMEASGKAKSRLLDRLAADAK